MMYIKQIVLLVLLTLFQPNTLIAQTQSSEKDFSDYYSLVYQIQVISPEAGSKTSFGSGFQVTSDGLIMTNFHVVSDFINSPDSYEIHYVDKDDNKGKLKLVNFDVVNDLALLQHPSPSKDYFKFSATPSLKGETLYALGNPHDWGMVMVPGPNNGLVDNSYNEQILFSGSLNSGMSGGPSVNKDGEIVGVNVATAGSQLSFLIPVKHAITLTNKGALHESDNYQSEISSQIRAWQEHRLGELISADWTKENFADRKVIGELRRDFRCWGESNEDEVDRRYSDASRYCYTTDNIYVANDLDIGELSFWFSDSQSLELNQFQFANSQAVPMYANTNSAFEHSTNFRCNADFLNSQENTISGYIRVTTCIRAYKNLPGLYDSVLLIQEHETLNSFSASMSISGAEKHQIKALNKKFIESAL